MIRNNIKHIYKKGTLAVFVGVLFCGLLVSGCAKNKADNPEREGYTLVWQDEFNGDSLDLTKWSYQLGDGSDYGNAGWGNGESEWYTDRPENVSVGNGVLKITALKEQFGRASFTSGRIRTITDDNEVLFATTYGRVEAKIKMQGKDGVWPAFWMLPVDPTIYGTWAASGELDIMEARGRIPTQVVGTAHFGKSWPNNSYLGSDYNFPDKVDTSTYHVYAIDWTPSEISWYVDDECYFTLDNWFSHGSGEAADFTSPAPFDVDFYILLNVAVGGNFDPQAVLRESNFPGIMEVDYVRVYKKNEGYDDKLELERAKADGLNYDEKKPVLNNKNYIYNGNFNQGTNGLAFWHKEGDTLWQTGYALEEGATYGIRYNASSDTICDVTVEMRDSLGNLIHSEVTTLKQTEDLIYAFTYECNVTDDMCSISISAPESAKLKLSNVIMMKLSK